MMGWYHDGSMGTGGWIAMILMMSLFWGAVILVGVMLFRGAGRGGRNGAPVVGAIHRSPIDILDERFARGEIENEEYEARRAILLGTKR